jgi:hypothetical protein
LIEAFQWDRSLDAGADAFARACPEFQRDTDRGRGMIGFLLMAAVASARGADADIASPQPAEMLQECIRGTLSDASTVDAEPLADGMRILVTLPNKPGRLFYDLTDIDGVRHVAVTHDPPASPRAARKSFLAIGEQCFPDELKAAGFQK